MLAPDKRHIHHQLMAGGLSQRGTMLVLSAASAAFGALAVLLVVAAYSCGGGPAISVVRYQPSRFSAPNRRSISARTCSRRGMSR